MEKLTAVSIVRRGVFVVRELFDIRMRSDDTFGQNLVLGYLRSAEDSVFETMPLIDHDAHGRRRLIYGNHAAAAHFEFHRRRGDAELRTNLFVLTEALP